jgi:hypothetical protein
VRPGKYLAAGLALAALIAAILVFINSTGRPRLEGSILQMRNVATDTRANVVILDVRITNPGRALFMVRDVIVVIVDAAGVPLEADAAAEPDIDRLLAYHKMLGPRYNPTLKSRERIAPGETKDYTVAGAFALTEQELAQRRSLRLRLVDVDGAAVEIGPPRR